MSKRSVISDGDLLKGAQALAADMSLPDGGRIKLARIIDDHLGWFERARGRGLEWSDIVALLARAGATRGDGRPLSRGHVSSLVWRKQQGSSEPVPMPVTQPRVEAVAPPVRKSSRRVSWLAEIGAPAVDGEPARSAKVAKPRRRRVHSEGSGDPEPLVVSETHSIGAPPKTDGDKLLASMRRAARLRRDD